MNYFDRVHVAPYFDKWDAMKDQIGKLYSVKDRKAIDLMQDAIDNYAALLNYGGKAVSERTEKDEYILLGLNGEERFEFVKARINSHYAFTQLEALYIEAQKKAAALSTRKS